MLLTTCISLNTTINNFVNAGGLYYKAVAAYFNYYLTALKACEDFRLARQFYLKTNKLNEAINNLLEEPPSFKRMLALSRYVERMELYLYYLNCSLNGLRSDLKELSALPSYVCAGNPTEVYLKVFCSISNITNSLKLELKKSINYLNEEVRDLGQSLAYYKSVLNGCRVVNG